MRVVTVAVTSSPAASHGDIRTIVRSIEVIIAGASVYLARRGTRSGRAAARTLPRITW
ncbi:MAG: hypothetical protein BWX80_03669 [Candidatus Hydrogenedentes bacterium ADurb.Bin101]|nr:MAG: hypothetical protein BWX80_03669 [Candidatus Hydrogenedentes bacterium ADurb.Bin101]